MEAIILMIIIGLISSFVNKKQEQKKPAKSMPPFNQSSAPQKPASQHVEEKRKSLEDFASDIFDQLARKQEQKVEVAPVVEVEPPRQTVRPPLEERPLVRKLKQEPAFQVVPKTQQQVMQAVVMAEILGKPKARK